MCQITDPRKDARPQKLFYLGEWPLESLKNIPNPLPPRLVLSLEGRVGGGGERFPRCFHENSNNLSKIADQKK